MSKPIQIAISSAPGGGQEWGCAPFVRDRLVVLLDDGRVYEQYSGYGELTTEWTEIRGPWSMDVPFGQCKNPDCPIGCPDSHAVTPSYLQMLKAEESRDTVMIYCVKCRATGVLDWAGLFCCDTEECDYSVPF